MSALKNFSGDVVKASAKPDVLRLRAMPLQGSHILSTCQEGAV